MRVTKRRRPNCGRLPGLLSRHSGLGIGQHRIVRKSLKACFSEGSMGLFACDEAVVVGDLVRAQVVVPRPCR